MSKVVHLTDYIADGLSADEAVACARQLLMDQQVDLEDENQQLLHEVFKLEDRFESQRVLNANLKAQLKDVEEENLLLMSLLKQEQHNNEQSKAQHEFDKKMKAQQAYWEKEYGELKDKIRQLETKLEAKSQALELSKKQSEQLLNELLSKD